MVTESMLWITAGFVAVWCSVLILTVRAWQRYEKQHAPVQPAPSTATPLGKAVWDAHEAAVKLDSEISLGSPDEITEAAIQAAITAEKLCQMLRDGSPRISDR